MAAEEVVIYESFAREEEKCQTPLAVPPWGLIHFLEKHAPPREMLLLAANAKLLPSVYGRCASINPILIFRFNSCNVFRAQVYFKPIGGRAHSFPLLLSFRYLISRYITDCLTSKQPSQTWKRPRCRKRRRGSKNPFIGDSTSSTTAGAASCVQCRATPLCLSDSISIHPESSGG